MQLSASIQPRTGLSKFAKKAKSQKTGSVNIGFEYDGVSEKTYAIMCEDYASESGFEYEERGPQLGDGSLLAEFSDGTRTSSAWKASTARPERIPNQGSRALIMQHCVLAAYIIHICQICQIRAYET